MPNIQQYSQGAATRGEVRLISSTGPRIQREAGLGSLLPLATAVLLFHCPLQPGLRLIKPRRYRQPSELHRHFHKRSVPDRHRAHLRHCLLRQPGFSQFPLATFPLLAIAPSLRQKPQPPCNLSITRRSDAFLSAFRQTFLIIPLEIRNRACQTDRDHCRLCMR